MIKHLATLEDLIEAAQQGLSLRNDAPPAVVQGIKQICTIVRGAAGAREPRPGVGVGGRGEGRGQLETKRLA